MTVVHEERHGDRTYQVRTAGSSVRLYTNGVFHSQFSPSRRAATSIWDLLAMPALLAQGTRIRDVLVLGVGGGGVIRKLTELLGAPRITGVELDPVHIALGRRFFGLDMNHVELVTADAREWVRRNTHRRFDLVVDDLFGDEDRVARRAVEFDRSWRDRLLRLLSARGVMSVNFADLGEFVHSAARTGKWREEMACGYSIRLQTLENVVACIGGGPVGVEEFRQRISERFGRSALERCSIRRILSARRGVRARR
jgi:spermidine synthase